MWLHAVATAGPACGRHGRRQQQQWQRRRRRQVQGRAGDSASAARASRGQQGQAAAAAAAGAAAGRCFRQQQVQSAAGPASGRAGPAPSQPALQTSLAAPLPGGRGELGRPAAGYGLAGDPCSRRSRRPRQGRLARAQAGNTGQVRSRLSPLSMLGCALSKMPAATNSCRSKLRCQVVACSAGAAGWRGRTLAWYSGCSRRGPQQISARCCGSCTTAASCGCWQMGTHRVMGMRGEKGSRRRRREGSRRRQERWRQMRLRRRQGRKERRVQARMRVIGRGAPPPRAPSRQQCSGPGCTRGWMARGGPTARGLQCSGIWLTSGPAAKPRPPASWVPFGGPPGRQPARAPGRRLAASCCRGVLFFPARAASAFGEAPACGEGECWQCQKCMGLLLASQRSAHAVFQLWAGPARARGAEHARASTAQARPQAAVAPTAPCLLLPLLLQVHRCRPGGGAASAGCCHPAGASRRGQGPARQRPAGKVGWPGGAAKSAQCWYSACAAGGISCP